MNAFNFNKVAMEFKLPQDTIDTDALTEALGAEDADLDFEVGKKMNSFDRAYHDDWSY